MSRYVPQPHHFDCEGDYLDAMYGREEEEEPEDTTRTDYNRALVPAQSDEEIAADVEGAE